MSISITEKISAQAVILAVLPYFNNLYGNLEMINDSSLTIVYYKDASMKIFFNSCCLQCMLN